MLENSISRGKKIASFWKIAFLEVDGGVIA
jgi:hypothetical protein